MNNEQQNNDARFYLKELENGDFVVCDKEAPEKRHEVCIFRPGLHPYAKKAAEGELARLIAWNREGGTIRPLEFLRPPHRAPLVIGKVHFTLTVDEKRRFLAEIFRSPDSTAADKFKALQEDNRMLAMLSIKNGKERNENTEKE